MSNEPTEKTIATFCTGMEVGNEIFAKQEAVTMEDLLPSSHALFTKCDRVIKEPGCYNLTLTITRIK